MTGWLDEARRQFGRGLDAVGLGPREVPHRVAAHFSGARLRAYHPAGQETGPVLVIVLAPFKRAYIWDLLPEVSVVRRALRHGLRVYLLEWLIPSADEDGFGLAEYAGSLPAAALDRVAAETGCRAPLLCGHSMGGTLAALHACLRPDRVGGLILVDAPLAFGEQGGPLALAAKAAPPARAIREAVGSPVPGSAINALSARAAPDVFQVQRVTDLAACLLDPAALAIHARVERWTYDEFPLPGRLFEDVVDGLYREDRLMAGTLQVGERRVDLADLRAPTLAVVNPPGHIVPPRSLLDGLEAARPDSLEVLHYEGDRGPVLQHLGPLVGRNAHRLLWPRVLDWTGEVAAGRAGR